jgi:hypothetical protein
MMEGDITYWESAQVLSKLHELQQAVAFHAFSLLLHQVSSDGILLLSLSLCLSLSLSLGLSLSLSLSLCLSLSLGLGSS